MTNASSSPESSSKRWDMTISRDKARMYARELSEFATKKKELKQLASKGFCNWEKLLVELGELPPLSKHKLELVKPLVRYATLQQESLVYGIIQELQIKDKEELEKLYDLADKKAS
jgi:hypothetical protein